MTAPIAVVVKKASMQIGQFEVSNRSQCRYVVINTRPEAVTVPCEHCGSHVNRADCLACRGSGFQTYVGYANIIKRTDNLSTAVKVRSKQGFGPHGSFALIVDTETGKRV